MRRQERCRLLMDAASANTLSCLEADVSELSSFVRVLSSNPSLAGSEDRSEEDELPQADSLYVGYDNGCWLQVRRLDVLEAAERAKLEAPPEASKATRSTNSIYRGTATTRESGLGISTR
jgi:adenylate cyclase